MHEKGHKYLKGTFIIPQFKMVENLWTILTCTLKLSILLFLKLTFRLDAILKHLSILFMTIIFYVFTLQTNIVSYAN